MKTFGKMSMVCAIVFLFGFQSTAQNEKNSADKTLSPYFFVQSDDPRIDQLPLRETTAKAEISGVVANVVVNQVYENKGTRPIEAIYVFPASTRAAVYALQMTIGERTITAQIKEREQARKEYEEAKSQGKTASLLEEQRPNVFQMNVANILPGDVIKVELKYTELLVPTDGVYEFVYPTVVGPRYSNTPMDVASANEKWIGNPYLTEGKSAPYGFDIRTSIQAGMPIRDLKCNTHDVNVAFKERNKVEVSLKNGGSEGGNRDYVLQYRLSGGAIETGVLLFPEEKENFFIAMIEGPQAPKPEQIPPREYVFIVDVSGSMSGFPLDVSKKLLTDLIGGLRPIDKFNVVLFAGAASTWSPSSLPANQANITKAISFINSRQGGGGTELLNALQTALSLPSDEGCARTFVIATDGYVSVEKEAFEFIRSNLGNANFFAFGIGSSVNRYIIEGIAKTGKGEPFVVLDGNQAPKMADKFRKYIESPVLTNIKVRFEGFDAYDLEPEFIPDVFAQRPVMLVGKYRGNAQGRIILEGYSGNGKYTKAIDLAEATGNAENSALKYLWARERVARLDDYSGAEQNKDEVTALGLNYSLLTKYTSFVAIDSEVRNSDGSPTTVSQPLPLPQGVSNLAVGGVVSSYQLTAPTSGVYNISKSANLQAVEVQVVEDADVEEPVHEMFMSVEQQPSFIGGEVAMREFFRKNLRYPSVAKQSKISGKVFVEFVVRPDGTVTDVKVIKGIGGGCNDEAIRLVKLSSGKWNPGKQQGKAVPVKMTLPIEFRLN